MTTDPINLFYEEPAGDRWLPYDRYPRALVRRLVRGKPLPGGQKMVFLNLLQGLRRLGIPVRINDYRFAKQNPRALACIIGKPNVLGKIAWRNPILFGSATSSHPCDDPDLFNRLPVKKALVPGLWSKEMFRSLWGDKVESWPVGIDTDLWAPNADKTVDVLIYDKIRWERDRYEGELLQPIRAWLKDRGLSFSELRYGYYRPDDLRAGLSRSRAMIFLCEHETQGLAYQQALSSGVPVFAWDRGGPWKDPSYYPHRVMFEPVTSVPYWDSRCGLTFKDVAQFQDRWTEFWESVLGSAFRPRQYVLENLTLEHCARAYMGIARSVS